MLRAAVFGVCWLAVAAALSQADEAAARRGYEFLLTKAYVPASFDEECLANVWKVWPEPLRSQAEQAGTAERRRMAFARYGLTPRPGDASGKPLQFVVDDQGRWSPNCFTCHGGQILGQVVPGLPNSLYALATLTEEMRAIKLQLGKALASIDYGSLVIPLGGTRGTTNAVIFGIGLGGHREPDLSLRLFPKRQELIHHDLDAPPWWHFRKRDYLYLDGFAPRGHRGLMQFAQDRQNGPEKFREWERDFEDIYAYLMSLEPPKFPLAVDSSLAAKGRPIFERACAECHGSYGDQPTYPLRTVPLEEIGTDRARFDAIKPAYRRDYEASWFAHFGADKVRAEPVGYVAPPLDGIWASAPYLHNGSVPTLWHLLHPDQRPVVWRRTATGYDAQRVGLEISVWDELPTTVRARSERREYFDTRQFGKSAGGHGFPNELTEDEKSAVLEYLKTL